MLTPPGLPLLSALAPPRMLLLGLLAATLATAVITDLRARRIPDLLTLPSLLLALVVHGAAWGWSDGPGSGLLWALLGAAGAALPLFAVAVWRPGAFGGGDIKLMAAVGAALGLPLALEALVYVAVAGGIHASVALALARVRGGVVRGLPYAVAIAAGVAWVALVAGPPGG